MNSIVYFLKAKNNLKTLFDKALFRKLIEKDDIVALKIHFGEPGNNSYIKPPYAKEIIEAVKTCGGKPFLTDANTIYKGSRSESLSHLETAYKHGFTYEGVSAPVIIADGVTGRDFVKVKVNLKHFKEVNISSAAHLADALIALTHFKGHDMTGFGGSIKNIGMGLGSRSGKQLMHAEVSPRVDEEKCTGCEACIEWCPTNAISIGPNKKAFIDLSKCIGCAECIAVCRFEAISVSWAGTSSSLQERMTEYAYGVIKEKKGKIGYFNFLLTVSPNCDCYSHADPPIVPDIGILASKDIVAIDQASVDLINKTEGRIKSNDKFRTLYPNIDWSQQLKYAEEIGLGSRKYELIAID